VRTGVLSRLEVASKISGGITPLNTSKEDRDQNTSKGDGIEVTSQKLSSSGRTLVHLAEVVKEETSGQNSPWRTCEAARTVGFSEAGRRLSMDESTLQEVRLNVDR
jgi:hypothetical protein